MAPAVARSSLETHAFGRVGYVRISGVIDETFSAGKLAELSTEQLILDLGRVKTISSFGVRRWVEMVSSPPKGTSAVWIIHAPSGVVDQLNMVGDFAGKAIVLSTLAPYDCSQCGARLALIDLTSKAARTAIDEGRAPERICHVCQKPLMFAENPSEFFEFFRSNPCGAPPPIVTRFLKLQQVPDGVDEAPPFKLLHENVTYYQLRGNVMPNLNVRRMTAGLEGQVVFDFARVCSVGLGAHERLTALLEQSAASAEVVISRAPLALLGVLSSEQPVKLASVILQGLCQQCGEMRPHYVPALEHLEDCRKGTAPVRSCPVCGGASPSQWAQEPLFLVRNAHAGFPGVLKSLQSKALVHLIEEAAAAAPLAPTAGPLPDACKLCGENHGARDCPTFRREPVNAQGASQTIEMARMDLTDLVSVDSLLGRVVGNYRLTKVLGEGASARVYLGEHTIIGTRVAVKILHQKFARDPAAVARFIKEARTTSTVIHDNVVQVLDINIVDHNVFCFIMEYLDGQTMGATFGRKIVPYEDAAPILLQICAALATAHAHGIVHRDLKPDNIYLLQRAGRLQVKIVDFGIAWREALSDDEARTIAGTILGTPRYMSPEQAFSLAADSRADIYSLGVIMFELAAGRAPFVHESVRALLSAHCTVPPPRPRSINPLIEVAYEEVILKALAKDPRDRFQTMGELGRAIAQARQIASGLTPPMAVAAAKEASAGAAMRRHPRLSVELEVDVEMPEAVGLPEQHRERMTMLDISVGGAFVRSQRTIPEVYTRIILHPLLLGATPLVAEVTRTTRSEDPETGKIVHGFGVNFIASEASPEQERTIQAILALSEDAAPRLPSIDAEIEQFLGRIEAEAEGDPYALLGVPLHASFPVVRNACEHLGRVLDSPQLRKLGEKDLARVKKGRERLAMAEEVLVDPISRATYDATRGNFVGIARCLACGLETHTLAKLREKFLVQRPDLPQLMQPIKARLGDIRGGGDPAALLEGLTLALRIDPLDIELQTQYWDLRRKVADENVRE